MAVCLSKDWTENGGMEGGTKEMRSYREERRGLKSRVKRWEGASRVSVSHERVTSISI